MFVRIISSVVLACLFLAAQCQQSPATADKVLKDALSLASQEHKNVFIIFRASWCGWCHKMDSSMNDASCQQLFNDNYIIRHLTVQESKNKKALENPGANEMLNHYIGADQGIPFWLIFDASGKLLADSQIRPEGVGTDKPGVNSGYPATEEEVNYFISVLKKTSRLT